MTRKRRGSLKGWWMHLPFVVVPFSLLFSEAWFQTQILHNEYLKNSLRAGIRDSALRVDELRDEIRELARMERVLERAPVFGLGPPDPGQVVEIQVAASAAAAGEPGAIITAVLASPPPAVQPMAVAKAEPSQTRTAKVELNELEPLEPESDWVE